MGEKLINVLNQLIERQRKKDFNYFVFSILSTLIRILYLNTLLCNSKKCSPF